MGEHSHSCLGVLVYIEQVGDRTLADCKVLIVDDQASSRLVLETLLEDTVACASVGSAKEAIEYCKYHTPDLILMDVSPRIRRASDHRIVKKKAVVCSHSYYFRDL